tara:strand:+ start:47 stop:295 length:249 start_codon:yes stop_codon:yes gene_type:complete
MPSLDLGNDDGYKRGNLYFIIDEFVDDIYSRYYDFILKNYTGEKRWFKGNYLIREKYNMTTEKLESMANMCGNIREYINRLN